MRVDPARDRCRRGIIQRRLVRLVIDDAARLHVQQRQALPAGQQPHVLRVRRLVGAFQDRGVDAIQRADGREQQQDHAQRPVAGDYRRVACLRPTPARCGRQGAVYRPALRS